MELSALILCAYLIGSIPFGYLIAKSRGVDILAVGSGSIGATNVRRSLGNGPAFVVFILDTLKGFVPAMIAAQQFHDPVKTFLVGMVALVGHCFSIFLKLKGGKGVATGLGALVATNYHVALSALGIFIAFVLIFELVSLASIMAALSVGIFGIVFGAPQPVVGCLFFLAAFVIFKHRANIVRLFNRTEPKLSVWTSIRRSKVDHGKTGAKVDK